VPFRNLKSGWIPISLFLLFTFVSNVLNRHGKILVTSGPLVITDEGVSVASLRTVRVLFMIIGAKILMASARPEDIIRALGRLMSPLERFGLPIADFFHTMGLTVKCFPALKEMATETYRENIKTAETKGFRGRVRVIASFLLPMFVKSVQSPEIFFEKGKDN
jgi:energy-coupling factor transport system permease protein